MPLTAPSGDFLNGLKEFLGPQGWREPADAPEKFEEPRGKWRGRGALVLRPETTEEVAEIIARAAAARVGVVPHAGGTGLVGGQVMVEGPPPLLLSLERMNRIRDVDPTDNVLIAEAGVILADIQQAAEDADRLFPLSLASEGSCRIGGNLATNAGGVQVLRYGNARDLCLGVEAVLPSGEIMRGLKRLRKDNTGYDLRHLLIGSEGTLGVITAAALKLFPRPAEVATAFLAVPGPREAVDLLNFLRPKVGDVISAFELIDRMGVQFLKDTGLGQPDPLDPMPRWIVLVETGGRPGASDALEAALAEALTRLSVKDAAAPKVTVDLKMKSPAVAAALYRQCPTLKRKLQTLPLRVMGLASYIGRAQCSLDNDYVTVHANYSQAELLRILKLLAPFVPRPPALADLPNPPPPPAPDASKLPAAPDMGAPAKTPEGAKAGAEAPSAKETLKKDAPKKEAPKTPEKEAPKSEQVEVARVAGEAGQVPSRAQLGDQARGVPGRSRGQLGAFEQEHLETALGQVVGDAAANDAAADDQDLGG